MPQRIEHQVISHHELLGCKGIHHQQNGTYPATDAWQGRLLQDLVGTRQQMSDFCLQRPRAFTGTASSTSILPISLSFWRRVKKRSITCPSTSPLPCTTVALLTKLRRVQKWAANWEDSGANWNSGCNAIMMWARRRLSGYLRLYMIGDLEDFFLRKDYYIANCKRSNKKMNMGGYMTTAMVGFFKDHGVEGL